jgi:hypothetical protein
VEYEKLGHRHYRQKLRYNEKYLSSAISHASGYHSWTLFPPNPAAVNLWVHDLVIDGGFTEESGSDPCRAQVCCARRQFIAH